MDYSSSGVVLLALYSWKVASLNCCQSLSLSLFAHPLTANCGATSPMASFIELIWLHKPLITVRKINIFTKTQAVYTKIFAHSTRTWRSSRSAAAGCTILLILWKGVLRKVRQSIRLHKIRSVLLWIECHTETIQIWRFKKPNGAARCLDRWNLISAK